MVTKSSYILELEKATDVITRLGLNANKKKFRYAKRYSVYKVRIGMCFRGK
jgi:hypothetical protein